MLSTSCERGSSSLASFLDVGCFKYFGATVFSDAQTLSIKDLHLNTARIVGKKIIFEGVISELDKFLTYVVMSNDDARMLVLLTEIDDIPVGLRDEKRKVSVFGEVSRGKKGLPFVTAKAIRPVP